MLLNQKNNIAQTKSYRTYFLKVMIYDFEVRLECKSETKFLLHI